MFLSIKFRQWKRVCSCFFRNDEEDLHGLDSITTSFLEQTELLAPFQTFRPAATEEEQTELFVPFRTLHGAETLIDYNSTLWRWFEAHE